MYNPFYLPKDKGNRNTDEIVHALGNFVKDILAIEIELDYIYRQTQHQDSENMRAS